MRAGIVRSIALGRAQASRIWLQRPVLGFPRAGIAVGNVEIAAEMEMYGLACLNSGFSNFNS